MAVSITNVDVTGQHRIYDVTASADADTTATITHNLGLSDVNDCEVDFEPLLPAFHVSQWYISARAANSITLTKTTNVGSGNASIQMRVHVKQPHSIVK